MTDISAICVRLSRGIIGAADEIMEYVMYKDRIYKLDENYDYTNKFEALKKAEEFGDNGIPIGIIYKEKIATGLYDIWSKHSFDSKEK